MRPIEMDFEQVTSPNWLPDGRRIAAVTVESARLVTMRPDGSDRRVVARNLGYPEIDWGPGR